MIDGKGGESDRREAIADDGADVHGGIGRVRGGKRDVSDARGGADRERGG